MKTSIITIALSLLLCLILFDRQFARADCRSFSSLIDNGSYAVADKTGRITSSCNHDIPFIPASIIKIPLALAAFKILGPEFQFSTELYIDSHKNLFIKGSGDPFLISEEVSLIIDRLIERDIRQINNIYIDNSSFDLTHQVPGRGKSDNPYDVPVSPTAVNFNTVHFRVLADGTVVSAEPQTPTVPLMHELGKSLPEGKHRVNICQDGCNAEMQSGRYTAELFRSFLTMKEVGGKGTFGLRKIPKRVKHVYTHKNTKKMKDIVYSFLKFSNNFVANLVFLRCGMEKYGEPATWEKARKALNETLSDIVGQKNTSFVRMEEGAGLSRNNKITAAAMLRVLEKFKPYKNMLQEKRNVRVKSGTLTGVYNYAGYLADGRPFVILLNQERNTRDKILQRLTSQSE